jgi:hypothetical protein
MLLVEPLSVTEVVADALSTKTSTASFTFMLRVMFAADEDAAFIALNPGIGMVTFSGSVMTTRCGRAGVPTPIAPRFRLPLASGVPPVFPIWMTFAEARLMEVSPFHVSSPALGNTRWVSFKLPE